jgi:hypothetical protein
MRFMMVLLHFLGGLARAKANTEILSFAQMG